jgi:tRNA(fMet)-specific endonuclease VapC
LTTYLLDTNILILYLRKQARLIDETYNPLASPNIPLVSVVTIGELRSFALQNQWGAKRLADLDVFVNQLAIVDINVEPLINLYAQIDAFSNGKLTTRALGNSARNMGKNDLWIAATASYLDATLLTTDDDFTHLDTHFIKLRKIDMALFRP